MTVRAATLVLAWLTASSASAQSAAPAVADEAPALAGTYLFHAADEPPGECLIALTPDNVQGTLHVMAFARCFHRYSVTGSLIGWHATPSGFTIIDSDGSETLVMAHQADGTFRGPNAWDGATYVMSRTPTPSDPPPTDRAAQFKAASDAFGSWLFSVETLEGEAPSCRVEFGPHFQTDHFTLAHAPECAGLFPGLAQARGWTATANGIRIADDAGTELATLRHRSLGVMVGDLAADPSSTYQLAQILPPAITEHARDYTLTTPAGSCTLTLGAFNAVLAPGASEFGYGIRRDSSCEALTVLAPVAAWTMHDNEIVFLSPSTAALGRLRPADDGTFTGRLGNTEITLE